MQQVLLLVSFSLSPGRKWGGVKRVEEVRTLLSCLMRLPPSRCWGGNESFLLEPPYIHAPRDYPLDIHGLPLASPVLGPVPRPTVLDKSSIDRRRVDVGDTGVSVSRIHAQTVNPKVAIDVEAVSLG